MTETIENTRTITLPSGKTAVIHPFKGKHIREASRIADGDSTKIIFALISMLTTIDGEPILMEDMDEMDGRDAMKLMGEFGEANF